MAVYVDELRDWGWRLGKSCHMTADTPAELHAMAARIGLRREYASDVTQPKSSMLHYDLTASKRARALAHGAQFVPGREQARQRIAAWRAARNA